MQVPAVRTDTMLSATVQTPAVLDANDTGSPDVAVATSVTSVPGANGMSSGSVKLIVWLALMIVTVAVALAEL